MRTVFYIADGENYTSDIHVSVLIETVNYDGLAKWLVAHSNFKEVKIQGIADIF